MRVFLAAYLAAVVILGALAVGGGLALYSRLGPDGAAEEAASEHGYNLAGWEIKHFPEKWLHKLQHLFNDRSEQERTDAICAYFKAAAELNSTQEPIAESANVDGRGVSALVIRTGGFSSYLSVVFEDTPYDSLMETVFHEWLHSYLILFPLGARYFGSSETRTLNESVANIGGKELA